MPLIFVFDGAGCVGGCVRKLEACFIRIVQDERQDSGCSIQRIKGLFFAFLRRILSPFIVFSAFSSLDPDIFSRITMLFIDFESYPE